MSQSQLTLRISHRKKLGKTSKRLSNDKMAAVYYGRKEESTPIEVSKSEFKKLFRKAGESTVVVLDDGAKQLEALIHEVDMDPVRDEPRHADFLILEKGRKVEVSVPLNFIGESPAVKSGLILVKVMYELEIEAEPKNLPHEIDVDISSLVDEHSKIAISDLTLPVGVESVEDATEVIASISIPKEEVVEEAVDLSTIEVEKKGKAEVEGEDGPAEEDSKDKAK